MTVIASHRPAGFDSSRSSAQPGSESARGSAQQGFDSSLGSAQQGFESSRGSAQQGFTLVELLVALVAGSMLLASLTWTLSTLGRELEAARLAEPRERLDSAAPIITGLIEQILPAAKDEAPVLAEARRFVFLATPPASLGAVGPVRVTLEVRGAAGGQSLLARFAPVDPSAPFPAAARADLPLMEGYRSIRFDYVMGDPREKSLPPRLVAINLVDGRGRPARIVAAPRLTASGDCRFDPISMTCRR
jgi:prepilin-type N-terminal cleavage/methylation domain-containing protein